MNSIEKKQIKKVVRYLLEKPRRKVTIQLDGGSSGLFRVCIFRMGFRNDSAPYDVLVSFGAYSLVASYASTEEMAHSIADLRFPEGGEIKITYKALV